MSRMSNHAGDAIRPALRALIAAAVLAAFAAAPAAAAPTPFERRMIAPGASYWMLQRRQGPLNIHVVEFDPAEKYISLACAANGSVPGRLPVSDLASVQSSDSRYAVAAVNGDYFVIGGRTDGALLGLNVTEGEVVSAGGGRSALVLLDNGRARVATLSLDAWLQTPPGKRVPISAVNQPRGRSSVVLFTPRFGASTKTSASGREVVLRGVPEPLELGKVYDTTVVTSTQAVGNLALWPEHVVVSASGARAAGMEGLKVGDAVKLCVDLAPHLEGRVLEAIGGGPRLVRDGRISVEWPQEHFVASHALRRHPRTAAGVTPDGRVLLVAVDGRQARSAGMTLAELAQLMLDLGCRDAVNLDGGGSTTMWLRGEVVNSPCEGRQRPVGNALLVMSSAPHGPPTRMRLMPASISALPGYRVTIKIEAQDEYYNPIDIPTVGVGWATEGGVGTISPRGEFTAGAVTETAAGAVKIFCGGVTNRLPVSVHARPAELILTPQTVTTVPGAAIRFDLTALDEEGGPISFDPDGVQWEANETAGVIEDRGILQVGPGPAGKVTATLAGVQAAARVVCASTTVPVEGFEQPGACTASAWPQGVAAAAERVTDPVREGKYAVRLKYDFTTTDESRAAYLELKRDLGEAVALRAWVYGDGLGHWLRGRITDAAGQTFNLDFAPRVDWTDWREVSAAIPPEARPPIRWEAIYVSEFRPERRDAGALVFDSLRAEIAAPIAEEQPAPAEESPLEEEPPPADEPAE